MSDEPKFEAEGKRRFHLSEVLAVNVSRYDLTKPEVKKLFTVDIDLADSSGKHTTTVLEINEAMTLACKIIAHLASLGHPDAKAIADFMDERYPREDEDT